MNNRSSDNVSVEDIVGIVIIALYLVALTSILAFHYVIRVRHRTAVIVERCGAYKETLEPGCHILIPFMDRTVNMQVHSYHIHYHK